MRAGRRFVHRCWALGQRSSSGRSTRQPPGRRPCFTWSAWLRFCLSPCRRRTEMPLRSAICERGFTRFNLLRCRVQIAAAGRGAGRRQARLVPFGSDRPLLDAVELHQPGGGHAVSASAIWERVSPGFHGTCLSAPWRAGATAGRGRRAAEGTCAMDRVRSMLDHKEKHHCASPLARGSSQHAVLNRRRGGRRRRISGTANRTGGASEHAAMV